MEPKIITPYGLRVLRVLSILNILVVIATIFAFKLPASDLSALSSFLTLWTYLSFALSIITSVLTVIAINKRSAKLYKPLFWLFILQILTLVGSSFTTDIETIVSNITFVIPSLFFLWYWIKMKGYFLEQSFNPEDPAIKKTDKKVNPFLITWIILIVVGSIVAAGISTVGNVKNAMNYLKEFEGKTFQEKLGFCQSQASPDECLIIALSVETDKGNLIVENCNLMSKDETKIACYAMIDRCNVVTDEKLKTVCEFTSKRFKEKQENATSSETINNN